MILSIMWVIIPFYFLFFLTLPLFQGHERRTTEKRQAIQREQKERVQTSQRF